MFFIIFLWALSALNLIVSKKALQHAKPSLVIGIRMTSAGILLLGYQFFVDRKKLIIKKQDRFRFFIMAIFLIYLTYLFKYWALQYISALKATILYSAKPFIVAIMAYFLIRKRLTSKQAWGLMLGLSGLIPTLLVKSTGKEILMECCRISIPEISMLIGLLSCSYAWFLVVDLLQDGYSITLINGLAMVVAGVMNLIVYAYCIGDTELITLSWTFVGYLAFLVFGSNIVVYGLYTWLLRRYSITFLTFTGFLCPCFSALYEWLFLRGHITWHYFVSLGLITLGLYVFYRGE